MAEDESLPEGWKADDESIPEGRKDMKLPEGWKAGQEESRRKETITTMDNKPGTVEGVILQMGSRLDTTSAVPDKSPEDENPPEGWKSSPPAMKEDQPKPSTHHHHHLQPHLMSEGFVRIGLVPSRESQPPVTPVDMWAVRGEGGGEDG